MYLNLAIKRFCITSYTKITGLPASSQCRDPPVVAFRFSTAELGSVKHTAHGTAFCYNVFRPRVGMEFVDRVAPIARDVGDGLLDERHSETETAP